MNASPPPTYVIYTVESTSSHSKPPKKILYLPHLLNLDIINRNSCAVPAKKVARIRAATTAALLQQMSDPATDSSKQQFHPLELLLHLSIPSD